MSAVYFLHPFWSLLRKIRFWRKASFGSALIAATFGGATQSGHAAQATSTPRPNILLLVADDLGWDDVGYHSSEIRTPNLDRLCREGVELDRFYVAPVCSPTRAGLLTGRYPLRYGLMHWPIAPYDTHGLPGKETTLPEMLATVGYKRRGLVGKWHLGHATREFYPLSQGFTHFTGHLNGYIDYFSLTREGQRDWHRQWQSSGEQGYLTDLEADAAVDFLTGCSTANPFFLFVAFSAAHTPLQAPPDAIAGYRDLPEPRKTYAAMVTRMDEAIGRIVGTLESKGFAENTLLIFISDNGGSVPGGAKNQPLRGGKAQTFEGGIRVPALMRWPAGLKGGRRVQTPVAYIDLLPTLARLTAAKIDWPIDGQEAWDIITGRVSQRPGPLFSFVGTERNERLAVMQDGWKLVRTGQTILQPAAKAKPQILLFRIEDDPLEQHDLSAQEPERVAAMLEQARQFRSLQPPGIKMHTGGDANKPPGWSAPKNWQLE